MTGTECPVTADPNIHPEVCGWQRSEDGQDDTDCGGTWELNDGTPPEHGMNYCPFCGKLIAWCSYVEEDCDDE